MSDTKEILHQILSDEKLLGSRAFRDRVYTDEPILRTASQLVKPETPRKISEMKEMMFTPEARWKTSAWLFYQQGKFMEDYEDDFPCPEDFIKYYPTYRDLTTEQLRGYFSWRKRVRGNVTEKAPLPFVFMYVYELLNCIGVGSPEEAFERLSSFCAAYSEIDKCILKYTDLWSADFIAYYGLDSSLAGGLKDIQYDNDLLTLIHWEEQPDETLFQAISALSAYPPEKSVFYAAEAEDFRTILVRSFKRLSEYFRDKRKMSLCEKLFGKIVECSYLMFSSAVFYDRLSDKDREFSFNEIHSYACRSGSWFCRKHYGNRGRNGKLGAYVKAVDSIMREHYKFKYKIGYSDVSKTAVKIIEEEILRLFEEKRRAEASRIEIDVSRLGDIRRSSDSIREKLLVDEEELPDTPIIASQPAAETPPDTPLDCNESSFMQALIYGGDISEAARKAGSMISILADSINDKLFDIFGDTVIDFSGELPVLIEDYTDELKTMFPEGVK